MYWHFASNKPASRCKALNLLVFTGCFLIGVGMTLPISHQTLVPILGVVALLLGVLLTYGHTNYFLSFRRIVKIIFSKNKLFFLLSILFLVSSVPGLVTSVFFDTDIAIRNIVAIFRFCSYIIIVLFCAALARQCGELILIKPIVFGVIFSCAWNLIDSLGNERFESLAGQSPLGISTTVAFAFIAPFFYHAQGWRKLLLFLLVLLFLASLLMTWSKGAWLNAIVLGALILVLKLRGKRGLYTSATVALLATCIIFVFQSEISRVVSTEISSSAGSRSNEMRIDQILNGLKIFSNYPLGVGNATYPVAAEELRLLFVQTQTPPDAHNAYIHVLVGFGLAGFIFYSGMLLYSFMRLVDRRSLVDDPISFGLFLAFLSVNFQGLFSGQHFTQPLSWMIIACILAYSKKYSLPIAYRHAV